MRSKIGRQVLSFVLSIVLCWNLFRHLRWQLDPIPI